MVKFLLFSEKAQNRLNALKELTGITDDAELIGNALQMYESLILETQRNGTEFYRKSVGGELEPCSFFEVIEESELNEKDPQG